MGGYFKVPVEIYEGYLEAGRATLGLEQRKVVDHVIRKINPQRLGPAAPPDVVSKM